MTTVLIVDDSKFSRGRAVAALEPCGYQLVEAADGQAGLDVAAECIPDVVVTDLSMPVLDGVGLLQGVRNLGWQIPAIVLCADSSTASREAFQELGPCEFLTKPFQASQLVELVRAALSETVSLSSL